MKKKMKKFMVFLIAVLLIWFASHFFSSPLAEKVRFLWRILFFVRFRQLK